MANKLKIDGDYVKDGSRRVARIYRDCIYKGSSTSSSNLLAKIYKDKFYNKASTVSGHCIGRLYSGAIYNKDSTSTSYRIGKIRDAERVISGRCSDQVLAAVYILMKSGQL